MAFSGPTQPDGFLPNIPGSADTRDLSIKCMTTDLPGSGIEPVAVALHGVELFFGGRKIYTHTMNVTFLETSDWSTRDKFVRWQESMRSWIENKGSIAAAYKVSAAIVVYNDLPEVVRTTNIIGMWPETINEVQLDGGQSGLVQLSMAMRYDYWTDNVFETIETEQKIERSFFEVLRRVFAFDGYLKTRYNIPIEGTDRKWEVDVFKTYAGTPSLWIKLDYEFSEGESKMPEIRFPSQSSHQTTHHHQMHPQSMRLHYRRFRVQSSNMTQM
jgi:hypothetical protein